MARELAYTGRRLAARQALSSGLVNETFASQDEMLQHVRAMAAEIASKSPLAVWGSKEMMNYTRDHSVEDGLNYIATWQAGMFFGGDMGGMGRRGGPRRRAGGASSSAALLRTDSMPASAEALLS